MSGTQNGSTHLIGQTRNLDAPFISNHVLIVFFFPEYLLNDKPFSMAEQKAFFSFFFFIEI